MNVGLTEWEMYEKDQMVMKVEEKLKTMLGSKNFTLHPVGSLFRGTSMRFDTDIDIVIMSQLFDDPTKKMIMEEISMEGQTKKTMKAPPGRKLLKLNFADGNEIDISLVKGTTIDKIGIDESSYVVVLLSNKYISEKYSEMTSIKSRNMKNHLITLKFYLWLVDRKVIGHTLEVVSIMTSNQLDEETQFQEYLEKMLQVIKNNSVGCLKGEGTCGFHLGSGPPKPIQHICTGLSLYETNLEELIEVMESLILKKKVTSYNSSRLGKVLIDALKDKNLLEFQSIKKTQEILGDNKIDAEVPILKEAMEYAGYYWDNIHYKFYKL